MGIALFEDVRLGESPEMGVARSLAIQGDKGSIRVLAHKGVLSEEGMVEALDRSREE